MFRKEYTNEDIIKYAKDSLSCAQLLEKLGLRPAGGNYATMKRKLAKLNIDCSHWSGQAWNRGKKLKGWENYTTTGSIKKHLIKHLGHKCEDCKLTQWKNQPISLEIHHVNGDRKKNIPVGH